MDALFLPLLANLRVTPPPNSVTLWADLSGNVYIQKPGAAPTLIAVGSGASGVINTTATPNLTVLNGLIVSAAA